MRYFDRLYQASPGWIQSVLLNTHACRINLHRYGTRCKHATALLREQERWNADRLREFKNHRLRLIVEVAYNNSAYYRQLMDERRLKPGDFRDVDDLVKFPILEKRVLREHAADMLTARSPRWGWLQGHTSGTTGSPLSVWYDRETCIMTNAVDRRHKFWAGMGPDDWIGLLLGRMVVPYSQQAPPFWRVNHVHKQVWFSSFHLNERVLATYLEEIRRRKLRFLEGYPSTLYIVARHLLSHDERLPMTSVITSSETLHEVQRQAIESAFECKVFDFYAMAERAVHAGECESHAGKHISEEYSHVEVVDEEGIPVEDGRSGFIVGTSLHNTAMPMVRYRLNDISFILDHGCDCGRTSRRMGSVATKAEDMIVTPDGRWISPSIMTHPFKSLKFVAKSQIIQQSVDELIVKIVPTQGEEPFRRVDEGPLRGALASRLGPDVYVDVIVVKDIEQEKSGKFRWVVSEVGRPAQIPWEANELERS